MLGIYDLLDRPRYNAPSGLIKGKIVETAGSQGRKYQLFFSARMLRKQQETLILASPNPSKRRINYKQPVGFYSKKK